ncbi:MAG TPA: hypothetical protein VNS09_10115 [Solirubrobacter sp.]|nr:hypothetical protein [Solirubrobacter sp.]
MVRRCIGCGAIDTPQPCLGPCAERRLDLVEGGEHAAGIARLEADERALADLRAVVARCALGGVGAEELSALRARSRAALRLLGPAPEAAAVITAWACDFCGRIEAPQPCIGVCIRPETTMVTAAEHAAVLERDAAVREELERLSTFARRVAWTSPRPGALDRHVQALQAQASTLNGSF